ncbi:MULTISPECIES: transglutaminase family protein [unclassified Pseudoalteromonas]|uniref:transglutaminase family protein n=1 Tax=unclassified Pseudoalteromonas TaxID=194690 RepID=UPI003014C5B9
MNFKPPIWYYSTTFFLWLLSVVLIDDFGIGFIALCSAFLFWQIVRLVGKAAVVSVTVINLITLLGAICTAVLIGFQNSVSMFVALMLIASMLKQLHATQKQQFSQVCILNFFTYPCLFLFTQSIFAAVLVLILLVGNLAIMVSLEQKIRVSTALSASSRGLLLTLPVVVLMVVFMPKLPAFWQLPSPQNKAKTGLSENVDPFNIAELSRSSELVFRASFDDPTQQGPFYWRAMIHDTYDGQQWQLSEFQGRVSRAQTLPQGNNATIVAQPSHLPWMYALGYAKSNSDKLNNGVFGTVFLKELTTKPIEYRIQYSNFNAQTRLSDWFSRRNTGLPKTDNKQTQQLALEWQQRSQTVSEFIVLMRQYFQQQGFNYTLTPTVINRDDRIDAFLFETQNGFCGHYASAAAFMLRSAGYPARLVSGYLGGEKNPEQGYYSVYQYDAHAWVEYFLPGQGWQRLDPTAWVSPERMNGSLSQLQSVSTEFQSGVGYSLIGLSNLPAINWLRVKLEELDYHWTMTVINFDRDKQQSLFQSWFGNHGQFWAGILVLVVILLLSVAAFYLSKRLIRPKQAIELGCYNAILAGVNDSHSSHPPKQVLATIATRKPEIKQAVDSFYELFEKAQYRQNELSEAESKSIQQLTKQIIKKAKE